MWRSTSLSSFRNALLRVGWPTAKPVYNIHNTIGLKFVTRLRLGLSHLNEHKFKHNLHNCINPLWSCSLEIKSFSRFFMYCNYFTSIRSACFGDLQSVDANIPNFPDNEILELLLYCSPKLDFSQNNKVIKFLYYFHFKIWNI